MLRSLVQSPMPGHLLFIEAHGDCHIKYGHMAGSANCAIKVAAGFYDNAARGLLVSNGLILVFDVQTGAPVSLFEDEGWVTAWRTAAATPPARGPSQLPWAWRQCLALGDFWRAVRAGQVAETADLSLGTPTGNTGSACRALREKALQLNPIT